MKRIKILFGQRRFQVLATLTGVIMAVAVVMASGASFTAHSANASNVFSTGKLDMSNSPSGMSFTVTNMVPGDKHTGTVTIQNTGDVAGHFYLDPVTLKANTEGIADQLDLTITQDGKEIYNNKLAKLDRIDLGKWAADEHHDFVFTTSFPDSDGLNANGPLAAGADNKWMGATTTADFNWTTVSVPQGEIAGATTK
jgi:hypothetical protein